MAKILTPLLRKLPTLSSTKLMLRCKCENVIESYTTETGCCCKKQHTPEKESNAEKKDCNVEKECSAAPLQNTSASSSALTNKICETVMDDKCFEARGSASVPTDVLWHQYHQCPDTPSIGSIPQDKPAERKEPPEAPTNCCMTGCPNCVWLKFAEDMIEYSANGGIHARKVIEEIEDENLKIFLLLELDGMQKH